MWSTGDPVLKLNLVHLEEPPFPQECWKGDKACAFADSLVLVAVHKSRPARAPEVIEMLAKWEFSIDAYKSVFRWMAANLGSAASEAAAAMWFLNHNKIWEAWITPEAAASCSSQRRAGG